MERVNAGFHPWIFFQGIHVMVITREKREEVSTKRGKEAMCLLSELNQIFKEPR